MGVINDHIPSGDCIAAMKIDIEGYEFFAFQGSVQLLKRRPPCHIFMEYHTIMLKAASSADSNDDTPSKLISLLRHAGYESDIDIPLGDAQLNVHWRLSRPPAEATCLCTDLGG